MFDAQDKRMVLGSSGLEADLPATAVHAGLLDYTPETQTVTGTFEQVDTYILLHISTPRKNV